MINLPDETGPIDLTDLAARRERFQRAEAARGVARVTEAAEMTAQPEIVDPFPPSCVFMAGMVAGALFLAAAFSLWTRIQAGP